MKNSSLLFVVFLLLPFITSAQAPDTAWTKTYGGTFAESGNFVQQTSDFGYIIAGATESYGVCVMIYFINQSRRKLC